MNDKAQLGFAFVVVAGIFILALFALIDPFKEQLDNNRGVSNGDGLNCPGTPTHNATDYADDTDFERLVRRPTCFVTGISMVWFVGVFIVATFTWVIRNWMGVKGK